jgi:hypothetical protein
MDMHYQHNHAPVMESPELELAQFQIETSPKIAAWTDRLIAHPEQLDELECDVDQYYRNAAGRIVATLLHKASHHESVAERLDAIRENAGTPLRNPVKQNVVLRLLCGIILEVSTLYCAPARIKNHGDAHVVTEVRRGLYPELALYGFAKKSSAALENKVSRAAVLYPSFAVARQELAADGLTLDVKEIRRIALQCGEGLLALRCEKVQRFFNGTLVPGNAFHGKRVVVELDGARMRHRENKTAAKGKHAKFDAPWREPKLLIIYYVDENGKKDKDSCIVIDATFQGADHAAELLAAILYEYGVDGALSVTFIADGATCLWGRFAWIVATLKLPASKVSYVLDFFHASHHVSLALSHLGYSDVDRRVIYKELRQSRWSNVVARLEELGSDLLKSAREENARRLSRNEKALPIPFETELNYLRHHGESGHLCYVKFWRRGLPLGSGAVESAIRRVVNLRLKSNGMFWSPENAEAILHLRCQVLSTEWSRRRDELYARRLGERSRSWRWAALDRSRAARSVEEQATPQATKCRNSSIFTPT